MPEKFLQLFSIFEALYLLGELHSNPLNIVIWVAIIDSDKRTSSPSNMSSIQDVNKMVFFVDQEFW